MSIMYKRAAKAVGVGSLLLPAASAGKTNSQALRKLQHFESNYGLAMSHARNLINKTSSLTKYGLPQMSKQTNIQYYENYKNERKEEAIEALQKKMTDSVSAQWASNGVMPQELFDAVIDHQVPTLGEWDVFAHGSLEGFERNKMSGNIRVKNFIVPPKTVVVFWNLPGTPTVVSLAPQYTKFTGLQPIPNRSVTAKAKTGNATARSGAYSVMHIQGDSIPDISLTFQDPSLPMGVFRAENGEIEKDKKQSVKLSQFLKDNGPGVYYVLSCRSSHRYGEEVRPAIQKEVARTERARERQRKYSDAKAFNRYPVKQSIKNIGLDPDTDSLLGLGLSGESIKKMLLTMAIKAILPYILSGASAAFFKGAYVEEMRVLLEIAQGVPISDTSALRTYAASHTFFLASALTKDFVFKRRARYAKRLQQLRKQVADAKTRFRNSKKKKFDEAMKMRKYGFDTPNSLQLNRLYKLHKKRLQLKPNAVKDMENAYALALKKRKRDHVVTSVIRALFSSKKANARKARINQSARGQLKLLRRWGFKPGMTKIAVNRTFEKMKSGYSLMNQIRGRIPADLLQAYNLAKSAAV